MGTTAGVGRRWACASSCLFAACAAAGFVACSSSNDTAATATDAGTDTAAPDDAATDATPSADTGIDADVEPAFDCTQPSATELPDHLRCTGLYDRWSKKTIAAGVQEYAPAYTFWSDGAVKRRWIYLPPGTTIDTTDMDAWVFPVGTKLWKEFVLDGKHVETRLYWKLAEATWKRTTYQWSADENEAKRLDAGYTKNDPSDPKASGYEIPAVAKCDQCHGGSADKVLGFEVVGLGLPGATGYTLDKLVADGRLTKNPVRTGAAWAIPDDGKGAKDALGWLHANCGVACHNAYPGANCQFRGMHLKLSLADVATTTDVTATATYTTTVNQASILPDNTYVRIAPGNTAGSAVHVLASARNNTYVNNQMPPIDSHVIDPTGVGFLTTWIVGLGAK